MAERRFYPAEYLDEAFSENFGHLRLVPNEPPKLPPYDLDNEPHRHVEIVVCAECGEKLGVVE